MSGRLHQEFLDKVNANLGIAHKVCRLYFDGEDRDDAFQEMMYQLWRSFASFGGRAKFSTWMYSVCLRTALTYRRKDNRQKKESLTARHAEIADQPSGNNEEALNMFFEIIGTLPPVNRAIILLHLEGVNYEEISAITGLTKSNVSVRLVRIKKELEKKMKARIKSIEDANF